VAVCGERIDADEPPLAGHCTNGICKKIDKYPGNLAPVT
jgi:hypothetical protein